LVPALLAMQPAAFPALAQDGPPERFAVVGVAGAILRAEPDGASVALAVLPAGTTVTRTGPDVVTSAVVWRPVRTDDGATGYVPAGLLAPAEGGASAEPLPPSSPAPTATTVVGPPQPRTVGSAPAQSVGSAPPPPAPSTSDPTGAPGVVGATGDQGTSSGARQPGPNASPSPAPSPATTLAPARTSVERRRGRDVTITHVAKDRAPDGRTMGAGRIVVGFKPGVGEAGRRATHQAVGALAAQPLDLPNAAVVQVAPNAVAQALAAYKSRPDVAWAEPDYVRRATFTPNDVQSGGQWALTKIGVPIAWDVTTGQAATRVAILDCGIFSESSTYPSPDGLPGHPDLRGKVIAEQNFTDAATGTDDYCDHGTLMAGIAGANTNNGVGVAGVGFNVSLLNGKVLNDNGDGLDSWVANGIIWATNSGANVISMSLGGDGPCSATIQTAIDYAWNNGAVIVAAAGNGGVDGVGDPFAENPANCAHVIAVGAIDQNDNRATFSNYGAAVGLAAPGVNVYSTDFIGQYGNVSGTSPATPHVAAVAALLKSTAYGSSNQAIVQRLYQTAAPIAGTGSTWAYGRLDAAAAVGPASCSPRPPVSVAATPTGASLNVQVTVSGAGNAVRFVQVGGSAGAVNNALVTFPGTMSQAQGITSYVLSNVAASTFFQVQRQTPGQPSTLGMTVVDGCGSWKSFVGGGTGAGF
jgi:thermitase